MSLEFSKGACPTVYGPVASRRHGRSLGINVGLVERKVCTWGCVYCQCGMGERREIRADEQTLGAKEILRQVRESLAADARTDARIDSITFAGNSEPAEHPEFPAIVSGLLKMREDLHGSWTVNCLSNGSELANPSVVSACDLLDETWIKLDCATDEAFLRLNRPVSKVGTVADHVCRIKKLSKICLQTLVWTCPTNPKLANWNEQNRDGLLALYRELNPKRIHLTTVARATAVAGLQPVPTAELASFAKQIQDQGHAVEVFE